MTGIASSCPEDIFMLIVVKQDSSTHIMVGKPMADIALATTYDWAVQSRNLLSASNHYLRGSEHHCVLGLRQGCTVGLHCLAKHARDFILVYNFCCL